MSELIYPTLDLFAYQLGEGLGDNQDEVKKRRDSFLKLLPQNLEKILTHIYDEELACENHEYMKLLEIAGKKTHAYDFDKYLNNYVLKGYYYPVRLNDTYGLLFDCSVDEKDIPQTLNSLRYLKQQTKPLQGSLGKTWFISGIIPNLSIDHETLAKNIYKAFMLEDKPGHLTDKTYEDLIAKQWQYRKIGKFLKASVFEVWQPPPNWKSLEDNIHVLIFIYPNKQSMGDAAKFYEDWMRLFCYRNKILWAYCETSHIRLKLKEGFRSIRETIDIINNKSELPQLKLILERNIQTYYRYIINLNYLEIQRGTIEINLYNYKEYLRYIDNYIKDNLTKFGDTDLKFLEDFSNIVQQKYITQAKKDYENLSPGVNILENQLNSIRGIVEIEQAETDRRLETKNTNFQNKVAVVGVGVATASLTTSVISPFVKDIYGLPSIKSLTYKQPVPEPIFNMLLVLVLSTVLGVIAGWITQKVLQSRHLFTK